MLSLPQYSTAFPRKATMATASASAFVVAATIPFVDAQAPVRASATLARADAVQDQLPNFATHGSAFVRMQASLPTSFIETFPKGCRVE